MLLRFLPAGLFTRTLGFALFVFTPFASAEGSWQFGLEEGLTHAQPLFEYNSSYSNSDTGLQAELRPLYVDIFDAAEVINVSLCGVADGRWQ